MRGHFRHQGKNGVNLLCYSPRDLAEARAGVPQFAFAILDNQPCDMEKLVEFLNGITTYASGGELPEYLAKQIPTKA